MCERVLRFLPVTGRARDLPVLYQREIRDVRLAWGWRSARLLCAQEAAEMGSGMSFMAKVGLAAARLAFREAAAELAAVGGRLTLRPGRPAAFDPSRTYRCVNLERI